MKTVKQMKIYQPLSINDKGGRGNQEDTVSPIPGTATSADRTFIVCDGMGGHEAGEVASGAVCEAISAYLNDSDPETFDLSTLRGAIESAYDTLAERDTTTGQKRMGTTLTLVHLSDRQAVMAHIGDSRIYHLRPDGNGGMTILYKSSDHSLVNELVRAGVITPEEAINHPKKNVITRAMQAREDHRDGATVHITNDVAADDRFIQCSDGVLECLSDAALCEIMADESLTDEQRIERITEICRSSHDNFSAYYVHVEEGIDAAHINTETVELRIDAPNEAAAAIAVEAEIPTQEEEAPVVLPKPAAVPAAVVVEEAAEITSVGEAPQMVHNSKPVNKKSNNGLRIAVVILAIALVALIGYVLFVPASDEPTAPESTELPEETEDPDYVDEPEATAQPAAEPDRSGKDAKVIHNRPARQLQKNGIRVPRNSVPGTTVPENPGKNLRDVDKDAKGKGSLKESESKSVTDDVQQGKSNQKASKGSHEEPQSATVTTNISSQV